MISPDHTNIMPLMTQSEAEALLKRPLPTDSDLKMAERLVGTLEIYLSPLNRQDFAC